VGLFAYFCLFFYITLQIVSAVLGSIAGLPNSASGGEGIVVRVSSTFHMFMFFVMWHYDKFNWRTPSHQKTPIENVQMKNIEHSQSVCSLSIKVKRKIEDNIRPGNDDRNWNFFRTKLGQDSLV
jgi:hypothetical protein